MYDYFIKYYNKLKQIGGIVLGTGAAGRVIASPIPLLNGPVLINNDYPIIDLTETRLSEFIETNFLIHRNSTVAKFFATKDSYKKEVGLMYLVEVKILPAIYQRLDRSNDFFCRRYANGVINYIELFKKPGVYNNEWFGLSPESTLQNELRKFHSEVIIYERGTPFKDEQNKNLCLRELLSLVKLFTALFELKIYIPDMKLENLILLNNKVKIIDYSYMNYSLFIFSEYLHDKETTITYVAYKAHSFDYQCLFQKMSKEQIINYVNEKRTGALHLEEQLKMSVVGSEQYNVLLNNLKPFHIFFEYYHNIKDLHDRFIKFMTELTNKRKQTGEFIIDIPLKKIDESNYTLRINVHNIDSIKLVVSKCFIIINPNLHELYIQKLIESFIRINLGHQQLYSYGIMLLEFILTESDKFEFNNLIQIIKIIFICLIHYIDTDTIILPSLENVQKISESIIIN